MVDEATRLREEMVGQQLRGRGVSDLRVLEAMGAIPRHRFVPDEPLELAYVDGPLMVSHGQTLSQPYIVAFVAWQLELFPGARVLEIGTGVGYEAAVLAHCGAQVFSMDLEEGLIAEARAHLDALGLGDRVQLRVGDGFEGWPEEAPFDRIVVACATDNWIDALLDQLAPGGVMIAPVKDGRTQILARVRLDHDGGWDEDDLLPVAFAPMRGKGAAVPR